MPKRYPQVPPRGTSLTWGQQTKKHPDRKAANREISARKDAENMKFGLHRNDPFQPLFADGLGFQIPHRDETRKLWIFSSEASANQLRTHLRHDSGPHPGFVFIEKISRIKERMQNEFSQD